MQDKIKENKRIKAEQKEQKLIDKQNAFHHELVETNLNVDTLTVPNADGENDDQGSNNISA